MLVIWYVKFPHVFICLFVERLLMCIQEKRLHDIEEEKKRAQMQLERTASFYR
jgi:hypothetical protein